MPRQLAFDLPVAPSRTRGDFFVAPSNREAYDAVMASGDWPGGKLLIVGEPGAGKTHLAHIWAEAAGARVAEAGALGDVEALARGPVAVDDADAVAGDKDAERALFHLHNLALAEGHPVLFTARLAPPAWGLGLPDLASRMEGTRMAPIRPPDDALLAAVLVKLFADRQVEVSPRLVDYLLPRMPRGLGALGAFVDRLDKAALAAGKPVTIKLAGRVLEQGVG